MQFRDEEYETLSLYRTDIGEAADVEPTPVSQLYNFCTQHGDAKGTLKFLIKQTKIPLSSNASVIPPPGAGFEHESLRYTPSVDRRQGGGPVSWPQQFPLEGPRSNPSHHSKEGSISSANENRSRATNGEATSPALYQTRSIGDGHETDTSSNSRGPIKRSRALPNGRRLPSSPSRSPMSEHHPPLFENILGHRSTPSTATPVIIPPSPISQGLRHSASLELELSPTAETDYSQRQGSITPTSYNDRRQFASGLSPGNTSLPYLDEPGSPAGLGIRSGAAASGSSSRPTMSPLTIPNSSYSAGPSMDGIDQETRDLILRLDAEERERERAQFEADRELALKEQQSEQEVWEAMQQLKRHEQQRQVEADALRAVSGLIREG
jgi:mitogen-activated protein kinase kinase kinase